MKFSVQKKLNLSRIDKELWPYESETYEASDADSFEEAQKVVDMYYAEREGYHRAVAESRRAERNKQASLPLSYSGAPAKTAVTSTPVAPVAPVETPVSVAPAGPAVNAPVENNPVDAGVSNLPPKEFN